MKTWSDVTKEDLEIAPGVINQEMVLEMTLNEYLQHIEGMIELGVNQYPEAAAEHIEDVMMMIIIDYFHVLQDRSPEPEEIQAHLREPNSIFARHYFVNICLLATEENWPELEKSIRRNVALLGG